MLSNNQKTINETFKISGVGLHNGINADLLIKPAKENSGINFCRVDIDENDLIPANFKNVVEPILCTKIANKNSLLQQFVLSQSQQKFYNYFLL